LGPVQKATGAYVHCWITALESRDGSAISSRSSTDIRGESCPVPRSVLSGTLRGSAHAGATRPNDGTSNLLDPQIGTRVRLTLSTRSGPVRLPNSLKLKSQTLTPAQVTVEFVDELTEWMKSERKLHKKFAFQILYKVPARPPPRNPVHPHPESLSLNPTTRNLNP